MVGPYPTPLLVVGSPKNIFFAASLMPYLEEAVLEWDEGAGGPELPAQVARLHRQRPHVVVPTTSGVGRVGTQYLHIKIKMRQNYVFKK